LLLPLYTVLLKQKKRPVLDITGFLFRMSTRVKAEHLGLHLSTHAEVLFGFLNIKCVKIYVMPYIFATTLLLYKLDTLLLKQNNLSVLDITGFFFRMSTQVKAEVARPSPEYSCGKRNPLYPIRPAFFVSIVLYPIHNF
jgi:hypothetical protein